MPEPNRFALLCIAERKATCTRALSRLGHPFELVAHPREVVRLCVEGEVAAVLLDTISSVRVGIHEMAAVYDMGIDIPVLRVSGWDGQEPIAMCNAPFRKGPLEQCLREIASDDPSWSHPIYRRHSLRVPLPTRIEIRDGRGTLKGYGVNASVTGIFALCWDPPDVQELVELHFLDLPFLFQAQARVHRNAPWDGSRQIPGCGLSFVERTPDIYRHMISDIHFRRLSKMVVDDPGTEIYDPGSVFPTTS
jgi:hypothetical protein